MKSPATPAETSEATSLMEHKVTNNIDLGFEQLEAQFAAHDVEMSAAAHLCANCGFALRGDQPALCGPCESAAFWADKALVAITAQSDGERISVSRRQILDAVSNDDAAILLGSGPTAAGKYNWYAKLLIGDDPDLYYGYASYNTHPTITQALQVARIGMCD